MPWLDDMAANITIRQLEEGDRDSVWDFFKKIDNEGYKTNFYPHPFTEGEAVRICHHQGKDQYYGIFLPDSDEIVGYGLLRGLDEGYEVPSLGLCILDAYQGEGLGRILLSYLLGACEKLGATRAMLKVKRDNPTARTLYEKAGFAFEVFDQDFLIGYREIK